MDNLTEIEISRMHESKLNPRKFYDQAKLNELADSIRQVGIIEPLVGRWVGHEKHADLECEIVSGNRRYRAAKIAGKKLIPVIMRELNDQEALEIMVIENNQRADVTPLEEAAGFKRLISSKYPLEVLAAKIGQPKQYVYDRLKLLDLIPEAKELLERKKITAQHAILISRLTEKQQKDCISLSTTYSAAGHPGALFEFDRVEDLFEDKVIAGTFEAKYGRYKAVSVRELQSWINKHCRFIPDTPVAKDLFPDTIKKIEEAKAGKLKVIQITHNHFIDPDAKVGNKERIYTCVSWKLANGSKGARECDKSVLGVIVAGPENGTAYRVCVNKECDTHWGKEKRRREKAKKDGEDHNSKAQEKWKEQERKRQEDYKKQEAERALWEKKADDIVLACSKALRTASLGNMAEILERNISHPRSLATSRKLLPKWKTAEDLLRVISLAQLVFEISQSWHAPRTFPAYAKRIGVDLSAILKVEEPKVQPAPAAGTFLEPTCIGCGCTQLTPCVGGCAWKKLARDGSHRGLCTACADKGVKWTKTKAAAATTSAKAKGKKVKAPKETKTKKAA